MFKTEIPSTELNWTELNWTGWNWVELSVMSSRAIERSGISWNRRTTRFPWSVFQSPPSWMSRKDTAMASNRTAWTISVSWIDLKIMVDFVFRRIDCDKSSFYHSTPYFIFTSVQVHVLPDSRREGSILDWPRRIENDVIVFLPQNIKFPGPGIPKVILIFLFRVSHSKAIRPYARTDHLNHCSCPIILCSGHSLEIAM